MRRRYAMLFFFRICALNIKGKGYTLLELLVTLTIVSVLALSAGSALSFLKRYRDSQSLKIITMNAITQAKLAALTAGRRVTLCLSEDGMHCGVDHPRYWLSFWDEAESGVMQDPAKRLAQISLPMMEIRFDIRGMGRIAGGLVFSSETVDNATMIAYRMGQHQPLWTLTLSRLGRIREVT